MTQDTFIVTVPPQQLRTVQGWNATPAHLAYRVGRGPHLFRAGGPTAPRGGLMVVGDRGFDGMGAVGPFCQEVVRECQARSFSGVILDFEGRLPPLEQMAARLDEALTRAIPPEDRETYEAVLALPKPYRTAIHLYYVEGYSVAEVAALMGAREGTVKSWLSRGRVKLAAALKGDE